MLSKVLKMEIKQGTDAWFESRIGKVTASRVFDVMSKTKTGYSASRKNYEAQLVIERLTNKKEDSFTSSAMQWGTDTEPLARAEYEAMNLCEVKECGLVDHPSVEMFGASPDGIIDDDGLIEIKCPNTATHLEYLLSKKVPQKYMLQMQTQMACTGRKWCDFVSFDPRLPDHLKMLVIRVDRDDALIGEIEAEVKLFLTGVENLIKELDKINENKS